MQRKDALLIMAIRWALIEQSSHATSLVCDEVMDRMHELSDGTKMIIKKDIEDALSKSEISHEVLETVLSERV